MTMKLQNIAKQVRKDVLKMTTNSKSAHIGSNFSIVDILVCLYFSEMKIFSEGIKEENRDRFILSKGHATAAVYSCLARKGFIKIEELQDFARNGSRLMSHISYKVPGVEFSTGSLGHGLPFGVGNAMALKLKKLKSRVFVINSDGELDELEMELM